MATMLSDTRASLRAESVQQQASQIGGHENHYRLPRIDRFALDADDREHGEQHEQKREEQARQGEEAEPRRRTKRAAFCREQGNCEQR